MKRKIWKLISKDNLYSVPYKRQLKKVMSRKLPRLWKLALKDENNQRL